MRLPSLTLRAPLFIAAAFLSLGLSLGLSACSDQACTEEGAEEVSGPVCCNDGCGNTTVSPLPRICRDGAWVCQRGIPVSYCATIANGCEARTACTGQAREEPDPAPDLCCRGGCDGTEIVHRQCLTGLLYECPAGAVPVSTCLDPFAACGGAIGRYRQNGHKIPQP
ncbi:MAG: hypothetical protein KAI47_00815 [Deltaproteobacteria bacterium]|nr:hypothetical protein [Deltaproteobacteria bacterium]